MTDNTKRPFESAMRDGTILGCLWTATFILSTAMLQMLVKGEGMLLPFVVLATTLMSPFVAYKLTAKHRDGERGGAITFGQAWTHIIIMYLCAILLSAIAQYIYYTFIDPNSFANLADALTAFASSNGLDSTSTEMLTGMFRELAATSTGKMLLSTMTGHASRSVIMAAILALIVKRNP